MREREEGSEETELVNVWTREEEQKQRVEGKDTVKRTKRVRE